MLVTPGADASVLAGLTEAADHEQAAIEFVASAIATLEVSDGSPVTPRQQLAGGPSVLYDAVVLAVSAAEAEHLSGNPAAKDFVTDAFAHCKFVGYTDAAGPLLAATGLDKLIDDGFVQLENGNAARFVERCRQLRYWPRQHALNGRNHG